MSASFLAGVLEVERFPPERLIGTSMMNRGQPPGWDYTPQADTAGPAFTDS
jgi:hypothetical protein